MTFFDSVTGRPVFVAPRGRTYEEFLKESREYGWLIFRDEEVVWKNVRVLCEARDFDGEEVVGVDGTHLGHNVFEYEKDLVTFSNRYVINLVSIAGRDLFDETERMRKK